MTAQRTDAPARRPRLVTFDFYTALVDHQATIAPALHATLGNGVDAAALARAWRTRQLEWAQWSNSLDRGRVPFRECTRRALVYVLAARSVAVTAADVERLVAAWDTLAPWPEAPSVLATIKARGFAIGVLSNGDEAMLRTGAAVFGTPFDYILASEHAGHYKPHPSVYALPAARLGIAAHDVLHVAGSATDAMGATLAGLSCAWSNRAGDPPADAAVRSDYELRDLTGLLEIL